MALDIDTVVAGIPGSHMQTVGIKLANKKALDLEFILMGTVMVLYAGRVEMGVMEIGSQVMVMLGIGSRRTTGDTLYMQ